MEYTENLSVIALLDPQPSMTALHILSFFLHPLEIFMFEKLSLQCWPTSPSDHRASTTCTQKECFDFEASLQTFLTFQLLSQIIAISCQNVPYSFRFPTLQGATGLFWKPYLVVHSRMLNHYIFDSWLQKNSFLNSGAPKWSHSQCPCLLFVLWAWFFNSLAHECNYFWQAT